MFVRPLQNQCGPLGKQVTLECEASGKPAPTARWLKNGRELVAGTGRFRTESTEDGVFRLILHDVMDVDAGDYTCEASNPCGSVRTTCTLKIGSPPRIDRIPNELFLPEGDNTKIKIYYSGDQPMEVSLTINGKPVSGDGRVKLTVFDEFLTIYIKDVAKDDAGLYVLSIKNDSGVATGNINVNITGLPGPPIGPLEVSDIDKHMCTLNWRPPAYDGGLRITHYQVERKDISTSHWIIVSSFCKGTTFTCQGLIEGQEYLFRVMAANENGCGPALEGVNPIKAKAPFGKYAQGND